MFLEWIAQLRLLQHDRQTNILGSLPLHIKRALVSEITAYLHPPNEQPPDPAIFLSSAHVKWFMEVIGQGFTLPLEDMEISSTDVAIYAQWLLEPAMRPSAVSQEKLEQEFYQIIFHQYSLLFQPRVSYPSTAQAQSIPHYHTTPTGQRPNSFLLNVVYSHTNAPPLSATPAPANPPSAQANKATLHQLMQRHVELCKKTLTVLTMAARTLTMTPETWTVLLKVILGVTDLLLQDPAGEPPVSGSINMGDKLCDHLLRVLFEMWLRSNIRQVDMWNILKSCFARWTHRTKVIQHWNAMTLALTNCVLNLLYGHSEGTPAVILSGTDANIKLFLSEDFVYYAWHRFIYLIPNPLSLPSVNFTHTMVGISKLVDAFLEVGDKRHAQPNEQDTSCPLPPDGNTLLHMFGTALFDACSTATHSKNGPQRDCAAAFGALCKIFCKPQRRERFLRIYVERFYAALSIGLKSDACLPTILVNCTELFATDLEGVRMLVPDFLTAIKLVLPMLQIEMRPGESIDELRLAAIKVVGTIMCLPNHYDKVELRAGWEWDIQCVSDSAPPSGQQAQLVAELIKDLYANPALHDPQERSFTKMKFYILELLLISLCTETSSYNMRYLLHLINVYVNEDVPFCPGLVGAVVKLIQDKMLSMQLPSDVTLVAIDVLMDFVHLYDYVHRDSQHVPRELVMALSRHVDALINIGKLNHSYPLIVQAFDCMIKWILASQWIVDDRECYLAVLSTLIKGIRISERDDTNTATAADPSTEKKKRRDAALPPPKQLFQLPPRSGRGSGGAHTSNDPSPSPLSSTSRVSSHHVKQRKEEIAIRTAAEYCLSQLVNQLGLYPNTSDRFLVSRRPTCLDDIHYIKQREMQLNENKTRDQSCMIRYFMVDRRLLLAVYDTTDIPLAADIPQPANIPRVVVMIRDTAGKYAWSMQAQYKDPRHKASSAALSPLSANIKNIPWIPTNDSSANVHVPNVVTVNDDAVPNIDRVREKDTKEWRQWKAIEILAQRQQQAELDALQQQQQRSSKTLSSHKALPPRAAIDFTSPRGFRLLLSDLGFLLPGSRHRLTPIRMNNNVLSEIEALDMLNERDCISISAFYAQSGHATWNDLVHSPPPLSEAFLQFLHCLGWPINLEEHVGFKGKLTSQLCPTAPYYADRSLEFIVNVPYFMTDPVADKDDSDTPEKDSFKLVAADDYVTVIWIEDLENYCELAEHIQTSSGPSSRLIVYIFIHPLKDHASGLFWIRIVIPTFISQPALMAACQRLNDNMLIIGPLVDGMVVSRHVLGAMVRLTAISAHQACRVVLDTYTRPYVVRKQFIEDMAQRHQSKLSISEFYTDMFTEKMDDDND